MTPGLTPDRVADLQKVVTLGHADGRGVSLSELPLAQLLGTGEMVRAEDVRTLVNATPIRAGGGAVCSVVVTT